MENGAYRKSFASLLSSSMALNPEEPQAFPTDSQRPRLRPLLLVERAKGRRQRFESPISEDLASQETFDAPSTFVFPKHGKVIQNKPPLFARTMSGEVSSLFFRER